MAKIKLCKKCTASVKVKIPKKFFTDKQREHLLIKYLKNKLKETKLVDIEILED